MKPPKLSEFAEIEFDRVDGVASPATGLPFLILKSSFDPGATSPTTPHKKGHPKMSKRDKLERKLAKLQRQLATETRSHATTSGSLLKAGSAESAFKKLEDAVDEATNPQQRRVAGRRLLQAKMVAAENARFANGFRPGSGLPVPLLGKRQRSS